MNRGKGRYYDGRTAHATTVDLEIEGMNLKLVSPEGTVLGRWPLSALFRDERQPAAVLIGCGSDAARVEILDRDFADRLPIKAKTWSRRDLMTNKKMIYLWLAGAAFFVGLAILARRPIAQFITKQISPEFEQKAAKALLSQLDLRKCALTPEQSAALQKVFERLVPHTSHRALLKVDLMDSHQVNAYTFPGGHIVLLRGLVKKSDSPEELAGVLAHEIAHAQKRHVMQSIVESMLFVSLLNLAVGDASGMLLIDPATASRLLSLKMGRDMEREADQGAVQILKQAQISHQGFLDFFEKRRLEAPGKNMDLSMISTHPLSDERIQFLKSSPMVDTQPQILSDKEWTVLKGSCQSKL